MSEPFSYNTVAYPSMVFELIRPDQIGAVSILHGVRPNNIDDCRVLELGCGDGANLLSIAYTMPGSDCVGIDLSAPRIEEAKQYTREIGISNATFHHMDLLEFEPEKFGEFDFIIAHGIYSWVPEPVRDRILWIYSQSLKLNGVGLISYNTYPGWHIRELVREAMRFQTERIDSPLEKVANALRSMEFLKESSGSNALYRSILEKELERLEDKVPESIFHDDLATINQPLYFRRFIDQIEKWGLQFVSELEPMTSFTDDLPNFAQEALDHLWNEPIRREQYIDFIRGRFFRSSLLCRSPNKPSYRPAIDSLDSLYFSSQSRPVPDGSSLTDASSVAFSGPRDSQFEIEYPSIKSFLGMLGSQWPKRLSFSESLELLQPVSDTFGGINQNLLRNALVKLMNAHVVEARCFRPKITPSVSKRPKVSDLARWQISRGFGSRDEHGPVINMYGSYVPVENDLQRELIVLSDGTRDRSELATAIEEQLEVKPEDGNQFETILPDTIDGNLEILARSALLTD